MLDDVSPLAGPKSIHGTHGPHPSACQGACCVVPGCMQPPGVGCTAPPPRTVHHAWGPPCTSPPPISSQASPSRPGPQGQHTPSLGGQPGVAEGSNPPWYERKRPHGGLPGSATLLARPVALDQMVGPAGRRDCRPPKLAGGGAWTTLWSAEMPGRRSSRLRSQDFMSWTCSPGPDGGPDKLFSLETYKVGGQAAWYPPTTSPPPGTVPHRFQVV